MARQKFDTRDNLPSYRGYVILSFVFILYNDIKREEILNYPNEHIYQMEMFQLTLEFQGRIIIFLREIMFSTFY